MLSWANKIGRIRDIYSPGPCCVGTCAHSRSALEPERDKTGIPATAGGTSGEGSNVGTVPTRSGWLATMRDELLPPVLGCVFRSYYLAIYSPSKLLVGVFPCRRARSNGIYDISHVTVMLHYDISIRMLTQHNQES